MPQAVDDLAEIQKIIKDNDLVFVDIGATWCGPCKLVAPVFEKLSEEYKGKATFISVDLDEAEEISNEFNVTSVPTILFFKAGELVHTLVGGGPAQQAELKTKVAELTA